MMTLPKRIHGVTPTDEKLASAILKNENAFVVRYLRGNKQAVLSVRPPRSDSGIVLNGDLPWIREAKVAKGKPFGVLIAFTNNEKLYIGWAMRSPSYYIPDSEDLYEFFRRTRENMRKEPVGTEFANFTKELEEFMTRNSLKDNESPFCKKHGRKMAVLRGLKDTINFNGKHVVSAHSGPIPKKIAAALPAFIKEVEALIEKKACNVGYPELPVEERDTEKSIIQLPAPKSITQEEARLQADRTGALLPTGVSSGAL